MGGPAAGEGWGELAHSVVRENPVRLSNPMDPGTRSSGPRLVSISHGLEQIPIAPGEPLVPVTGPHSAEVSVSEPGQTKLRCQLGAEIFQCRRSWNLLSPKDTGTGPGSPRSPGPVPRFCCQKPSCRRFLRLHPEIECVYRHATRSMAERGLFYRKLSISMIS